jgi:small subunit ribosomal protein S4
MAVYHDARCRLCRREGLKLFLKGTRCFSDKCAIERRAYPPGEHGKSRRVKETNYGQQLREKQKARRVYWLLERQFRHFFTKATESKGVTGDVLLQMLERRIDNVLYRLGFALSRKQARQLVAHGHVLVNGRKVNIPSALVKVGDEITLKEKSRQMNVIQSALESRKGQSVVEWLELRSDGPSGRVLSIPTRDSIQAPVNEQLIVELYSK